MRYRPLFLSAGRARCRMAALGFWVALSLSGPCLRADEAVVTVVSSQVSADYGRVRLADGTFKKETYTSGEGGHWPGCSSDSSIDRLSFADLAATLGASLAARNYRTVPDQNPDNTQLLIMVYWGTTSAINEAARAATYENLQASQGPNESHPPPPPVTAGPHGTPSRMDTSDEAGAARQSGLNGALAVVSLEESERRQADLRTAMMLGFDGELAASNSQEVAAFRSRREDLVAEIEENRYFVLLMAYDFPLMWKHRKHKLLWVTRMSMRERGTRFTQTLPAMLSYASQYFGQDSHGLIRKPLPEGQVRMGDIKSLGPLPQK